MIRNQILQWMIDRLEKLKSSQNRKQINNLDIQ